MKVIINIEGASGTVILSAFYENICKNIDLDDSVVDELFVKVSTIINRIKCSIEKYLKPNDKIIIGLPIIKDFGKYNELLAYDNIIKIKSKVKEAYIEALIANKDYPNYVHRLLTYGRSGLYLAELLQELQIAKYKRNFSGYEIEFTDDKVMDSNEFVDKITFSLSQLGFVCASIPTSLIPRLWTEE
ncbi:hypothetical protein JHL18_04710 [Clostridium sp. YIM B02505]|uniref:Uncharacterized protein n=1 Tax=Clostridium yunnanense TaxID=2800325 RepID=A0ABS1EKP4_9CLOT|nr:hypothetical protein [Clostridium yunnanense]MBK1809942.1 hypothetical protein [Clostridium yunnanense]